ncbi:PQQ-dependent sugar dehydrogenase [Nocardioides sp. CN2-186]|uniref:PQQ-dependent sugar dehydrogenase n=1 Tax=Nocardioides tweenelious TaxID=3156607 RepID=UPI0032B43886
MRPLVLGLTAALGLTLAVATPASQAAVPDSAAHHAARAHTPKLVVKAKVVSLDHPWDVRPIGKGRLIFTQRDRATVSIWDHGHKRVIRNFPTDSVWVSGETGLMGLETDPDFATNHRFYTCQGGFTGGGGHEVKVMSWTLNDALTAITSSRRLVGGFPTTSGRHGGCRLLALDDGSLYVGTGDAATGTNPENKKSLGGKTLRLDASTGKPWPRNPFIGSANHAKRYVQTYGHRNVQGLTLRKNGAVYSIEQGTYRDDEVNRLVNGGDYGYNPVPGYNEEVPMTDQSLPGKQRNAVWHSGNPTLATSGGGFVYGKKLGVYDGSLAVAALKAERVLFLHLDAKGHLVTVRTPAVLEKYGRIRTVVDGPGSTFYVTTDNGDGHDMVLAVHPKR